MAIAQFLKRPSKGGDRAAMFASPDPTAILVEQHREIDDLFHKLAVASNRATKEKSRIVRELEKKLVNHTRLEEKIFYPEIRRVSTETIDENVEEHEAIRFELRRLVGTMPKDPTFLARATVLRESVQRHVREEEQDLFPKVRIELPEPRLQTLLLRMQKFLAKPTGKAPRRAPLARVAAIRAVRRKKVGKRRTATSTTRPKR